MAAEADLVYRRLVYSFFLQAPRGTEAVVAEELVSLGLGSALAGRGGVELTGDLEVGYRACLWARTPSRALLVLHRFEAKDAEALYEGVHTVDWGEHFGADQTLAVSCTMTGTSEELRAPRFVTLKVKDAIVDRIRDEERRRPNIDRERPDIRIHVHVHDAAVTLSLDFSGEGLHHRGLGRRALEAPLKENLAAIVLRLAGWPTIAAEGGPLVDPMCGSGTLLIEGLAMALDVAPGLARDRHGFEAWRGHDKAVWRRMVAQARAQKTQASSRSVRAIGFDASARAVELGRANAKEAGFGARVSVEKRPLAECSPPEGTSGLLVTNPPYGERLGDARELMPLYETLGDVLRRRFGGYRAAVLVGNRDLAAAIGLRPRRRHVLFNGPIECRLLDYEISSKPVQSTEGPGWRKASSEASMFANRLTKNLRRLRPWAEEQGVHAYRAYDADIPEYDVAVDWYDGTVRVEAPRRTATEKRLPDVLHTVAEIFDVPPSRVTLRVRGKLAERAQHEKRSDSGDLFSVREGDLRFLVNLTDYLDTGLFLPLRRVRERIRKEAQGKRFLNLFAYTCTASVHAAAGGAASTTSVDLSNTYLDWGKRNFELNRLKARHHGFERADVLGWLRDCRDVFDLVLVGPPLRSVSKALRDPFELEGDGVRLLRDVARVVSSDGTILFTAPPCRLDLEAHPLPGLTIRDVTSDLTAFDFARNRNLGRTWEINAVP